MPVGRTTEYVMNSIAVALVDIMADMSFDDISICAIVDRAQVSRNSYYRHFGSKDDVLRHYLSVRTDKWLRRTRTRLSTMNSLPDFVVTLLEHLRAHRDVVDLLRRDGKMSLLEEEFDTRFRKALSATIDPWHIALIIGGFYKLFCFWAETRYEESPAVIASFLHRH